ncbi:MAG: hypothetical protein ACM3OB_03895 [Acidobacteriota bacterium]
MAAGTEEDSTELARRLRDADAETLLALVKDLASSLDVAAARQALRNPFAGAELIEALLAVPSLVRYYEVQRVIALHPRTPEVHALRLVPGLFWIDLVRLGLDTRVKPVVRRAADERLIERVPRLSVGERIAVARRASSAVLSHLRHDPTPRVIAALLENPRLTEGTLLPLLAGDASVPAVLAIIAQDPRWGTRYPVRVALCRNPRTPVPTALGLLPGLRKVDLGAVESDPRLAGAVRQRAQLLLGR